MDLIRSCYEVMMQLGDNQDPTLVRWFRCSSDAKCLPFAHSFGSMDWDEGEACFLGEQRPPRGLWDSGIRPARLNGTGLIVGTADEFLNGGAKKFRNQDVTIIREPSAPVCGEYLPLEEEVPSGVAYVHEQFCGGIRWVAEAPSFTPTNLEAFLVCTANFPPLCPSLDGALVELNWSQVDLAYIGTVNFQDFTTMDVTLRVFPIGLTSVFMDWHGHGHTDGFQLADNPLAITGFGWSLLHWVMDSGLECQPSDRWDGDTF